MKKFIITALIALLVGGFSFTANAQFKPQKPQLGKQDNKESTQLNQYEKMLQGYESKVAKCLNKYNELCELLTKGKNNTEKNNTLQSKIEKVKSKLNTLINDPNDGAKARRAGIEEIEKHLNADQQTRFKDANTTLENVTSKFEDL